MNDDMIGAKTSGYIDAILTQTSRFQHKREAKRCGALIPHQ
jgi:hypothetical protein